MTTPEPKQLDEARDKDVIDRWFERAKKMTLGDLPGFLHELTTAYQHDYGTIVRAIAAASVAAAWAVEHSPARGITGFQAGCVLWEFIFHWGDVKGPARLIKFEDMLYPQYEHNFEKVITAETWGWLQEEANKNLSKPPEHVHPDVVRHWQSIADGKVPFGYAIRD